MRARAFAVLSLALSVSSHAVSQQAHLREQRETIRTYPFSDPDPVPILAKDPRLYPYFGFDGYTDRGEDRKWTVVRLENEHLAAAVLPEVGGKVFGATVKATGREFIYTNDVLKFRRIALRGPWTSGGIEFNFGVVGHAPSTATPVEYLLRRDAGGGVTCLVGSLDLPSRTRWTVAITLSPGKAYLETKAFWYNPTPFDQSEYSWSTAAVSAAHDLRYDYPGRFVVQHSASTAGAPWPLSPEGRDLSFYRQNDFEGSKSYFVFGDYAHQFGAIRAGTDEGLGHWALYDDMPGRKVWIWSLARDGGIWVDLLTDGKGQYSEPQAGRLLSQVDHEFFPPGTGDSWREIWFPAEGVGRLASASPWAALGLERTRDSVRVVLSALQAVDDELIFRAEERIVLRSHLTLEPLERKVFTFPGEIGFLQVALGEGKLSYDENPASRALTRPVRYESPGAHSPEELFRAGERSEKERKYEEALAGYLACLQGEPGHLPALTRSALLYGRRGEALRGLPYATRALELDKYNPGANYAYGVLARSLGSLVDAREAFGWAARSLEFRSTAYCQIAEMYALEKNWSAALEYAVKSLQFNALNSNAHLARAIALRKLGRGPEALETLRRLLEFDPFEHQARFECCLNAPSEFSLESFAAGIQTEIAHESYLEATVAYLRLGLREEAGRLLSVAPDRPMVRYWRAYLVAQEDSAAGRVMLQQGGGGVDFVFPFREEEIPVLRWVMQESPSSWHPRYSLALLLWGKGRKEEALELMNGCVGADAAVFYVARALLRKELHDDGVVPDLEKAVSIDPHFWRGWHHLIAACAASGAHTKALEHARQGVRHHADQIVIRMDYASALYDAGAYEECLDVLSTLRLLPYEGSWEGHDLFVRANLRRALRALKEGRFADCLRSVEVSREYPEHLGTGEPWDPDMRMQDYLTYLALAREGRIGEAGKVLGGIIAYTEKHRLTWGAEHLFGLLALEKGGRGQEADALARQWEKESPNDLLLRWWLTRRGDANERAGSLLREVQGDPRQALRLEIAAW